MTSSKIFLSIPLVALTAAMSITAQYSFTIQPPSNDYLSKPKYEQVVAQSRTVFDKEAFLEIEPVLKKLIEDDFKDYRKINPELKRKVFFSHVNWHRQNYNKIIQNADTRTEIQNVVAEFAALEAISTAMDLMGGGYKDGNMRVQGIRARIKGHFKGGYDGSQINALYLLTDSGYNISHEQLKVLIDQRLEALLQALSAGREDGTIRKLDLHAIRPFVRAYGYYSARKLMAESYEEAVRNGFMGDIKQWAQKISDQDFVPGDPQYKIYTNFISPDLWDTLRDGKNRRDQEVMIDPAFLRSGLMGN